MKVMEVPWPLDERTLARFWSKVDKNGPVPKARPDLGPCWMWKTVSSWDGYGYFTLCPSPGAKWVSVSAHGIAYRLAKGDFPLKHVPDHLCLVTSCVNPDHLEAVSQRTNILRGNGPSAVNARKTECKRGHPLSGENLVMRPRGGRGCRKCDQRRQRIHERRRHQERLKTQRH